MTEKNELSVIDINKEVSLQLADKETQDLLIKTVFKDFSVPMIKQAVAEAMIRGFEFKDLLEKNVYAIKYGETYSLITSIDYSRKIAMRSGLVGKTAPIYVEKDNTIETCSITVKKATSGVIGEFTALVYFKEFNTGKNQWQSKPHVMIAKVAEMHALRMAFPEEMSQQYVEEEMQKEVVKNIEVAKPANLKTQIISLLKELGEDVGSQPKIKEAIKRLTSLDAAGDDAHLQEIINRLSVVISERAEQK